MARIRIHGNIGPVAFDISDWKGIKVNSTSNSFACAVSNNPRVASRIRFATTLLPVVVICVCRIGTVQAEDAAPRFVLSVPSKSAVADDGMLVRELARQALLIAARDELGLTTSDGSLREADVAHEDMTPVTISLNPGGKRELVLKVIKSAKRPATLKAFRIKVTESSALSNLTTHLEGLSRNEFPDVLKKASYTAKELKPSSDQPISDKVTEQLESLSVFLNLAAVRSLHEEIHGAGESAARLSGLSRGYANLGSLTEFLWSPAHKVFKARALLYAARLHAKYPSEDALRARAYVKAVVGLHADALEDLAEANKTANAAEGAESQIVEAYCRGDGVRLKEAAEKASHQKLARYFQLLIAESTQILELRLRTAHSLLEVEPHCLRAMDAVLDDAPLGVLNQYSTAAPVALVESLSDELSQIDGLPADVSKLLESKLEADDVGGLRILINDLRTAGQDGSDVSEPSLMVAANLIHDMTFVHIWRRVYLENVMYGWKSSNRLDAYRELYEEHPYGQFIESFHPDDDHVNGALQSLSKSTVTDPHLEATEEPMVDRLSEHGFEEAAALKSTVLRHDDQTFRDGLHYLHAMGQDETAKKLTRLLREISPHQSATLAACIVYDWEYAEPHASEWEEQFQDDPLIQTSLARRYLALNQLSSAERCLKARIKSLPDQDSYSRLASLYQQKDDEENWVQTLVESLEVRSYGLETTTSLVQLARHFMKKKESKRAVEYADRAAKSAAGWAYQCAAECHEQTGDWKGSEAYVRRSAKHYAGTEPSWYFWCRRTGRGDVAEARRFATSRLAELESSESAEEKLDAAIFRYCEGDTLQALKILRESFVVDSNPHIGLTASLIADESGDQKLRDRLLQESLDAARAQGGSLGNLIHDFSNALLTEKAIPIDAKMCDWRLHLLPDGEPTAQWYYLGRFLLTRGQNEEAITYLSLAATSPQEGKFNTLAGITLTRLGVETDAMRLTEIDGDLGEIVGHLKVAYQWALRKEYGKADEEIEKAMEIDPKAIDAIYLHAMVAHAKGDEPKAMEDLEELLHQFPRSSELLVLRAGWRQNSAEYGEAIRDYEKVIELDPNYGRAYQNLAALLAMCEDDTFRDGPKAVSLAEKSLEVDSDVPLWNRSATLASAYAEAKDFPKAVKAIEDALHAAPEAYHPAIKQMLTQFKKGKALPRSQRKD